jgi:Heat induced stress protein YflT domain
VDYLSDSDFPVESAAIVGSDVGIVEQVTGRMTSGRAALAGAGTGALGGLFICLLVGAVHDGLRIARVGVGRSDHRCGLARSVRFIFYWATEGRRDFTSDRGPVAERYDVMVTDEQVEGSGAFLGKLPENMSSHRASEE